VDGSVHFVEDIDENLDALDGRMVADFFLLPEVSPSGSWHAVR
jgi:hypothetical protein